MRTEALKGSIGLYWAMTSLLCLMAAPAPSWLVWWFLPLVLVSWVLGAWLDPSRWYFPVVFASAADLEGFEGPLIFRSCMFLAVGMRTVATVRVVLVVGQALTLAMVPEVLR